LVFGIWSLSYGLMSDSSWVGIVNPKTKDQNQRPKAKSQHNTFAI